MRSFQAAELFEIPRANWPCDYNEKFKLIFDDGEIITNTARTEVSRKLWLVHEHYDKLPIKKTHHIGEGSLSNDRIQDVLSEIVEDTDKIYRKDPNFNREHLWYLIYKSQERLYNESCLEYSRYVRSVSSMDFSRLYFYPPIAEIRDNTRPNEGNIDKSYAAITQILYNDKEIRRNPIVSDLRAGLVKLEQLLQIIAFRGYNTDIDDFIYPRPIMGNYFAGIHNPEEAMMESTLAAKAIIGQGQPLEQTEYANRKMQFTSHRVDLLVMRDCGSEFLCPIPLTKRRFRDMDGLFFYDEEQKRQRPLRKQDSHLIGKTIQVRLPFNCHFRHHGCICKHCYGLLANNIPYGANIGHIASTKTQSEVSQRVLKIKHSEASTVVEALNIDVSERPYILPGDTPNQIRLNPDLVKHGIKLLLKNAPNQQIINGSRLAVLRHSDLEDGLSMAKYSQFKNVTFEIPATTKSPMRYHVSVSRGQRMSNLSIDFLRFFLNQGITASADGFFHIKLDGWDFNKHVFELPNKHASMKDFAAEVEAFIRSTSDDSQRHLGPPRQLRQYDDPVEAIIDLHELISPKVPVHFTHLAVVMTSLMVSRDDPTDFRIPRAGQPIRFAKYDHVINGGSLGALFAYQGGRKQLEDIEQYMNTERDPHLLDLLLMPMKR